MSEKNVPQIQMSLVENFGIPGPNGLSLKYRYVSSVNHTGKSINEGHYFAYGKSNSEYSLFNGSGFNGGEAYFLLYELEDSNTVGDGLHVPPLKQRPKAPVTSDNNPKVNSYRISNLPFTNSGPSPMKRVITNKSVTLPTMEGITNKAVRYQILRDIIKETVIKEGTTKVWPRFPVLTEVIKTVSFINEERSNKEIGLYPDEERIYSRVGVQ